VETNGTENKPPVFAAIPSTEGESRSGLPSGFKGLAEKRRGVKPGTKRGSYNKGTPHTASAPMVSAPVELFTPENVRPLVSLPFNLAFIKTGFTGFTLSPGEEATLGATGAVALNQWVTIDPKYVAVMLFSMSLISIASQKFVLFSQAQAETAQRLQEANGEQTSKSQ